MTLSKIFINNDFTKKKYFLHIYKCLLLNLLKLNLSRNEDGSLKILIFFGLTALKVERLF